MEEKFNKKEYDMNYQKEHLVQFSVKMKKEDKIKQIKKELVNISVY